MNKYNDPDLEPLDSLIKEFKLSLLKKLLSRCTAPQQELFSWIFPGGMESIDKIKMPGNGRDALKDAIDLCQRTIKKNIDNPERTK